MPWGHKCHTLIRIHDQNQLLIVLTFLLIYIMSMNSFLYAYNQCIGFYPHFPFILCLLLTNILSPLSIHWWGGCQVCTFSFSLWSMPSLCGLWMTDPDLVLTTSQFCLGVFVVHGLHTALLSCTVSFCQTFMPLSAIPWVAWISQMFPSQLWEDQLWPSDASEVVTMDCGLGDLVISFGVACAKVFSNHPNAFLICSHMYYSEVMVVPHTCFEFHMMSLHHLYGIGMSLVVTNTQFSIPTWIHGPIFLLDCYCSFCTKDRRILLSIIALIFSLVGL